MNPLRRLEQYTQKRPSEVLLVTAEVAGAPDQVMVFKGFSSSLMRQTEFDPDIPVLPENAAIVQIDRLKSPYVPEQPVYLEQGLSWAQMEVYLTQLGL